MSSRPRTAAAGRTALSALSEKQIRAYLAARDVLRRIQRTSSLVMPPPARERAPASTRPRREGA